MNLNELAKIVTKKEGGKKEISIAQVKEVIKHVSVVMYENPELIERMLSNGKRNRRK